MRLNQNQIDVIHQSAIEAFGPNTRVWLFGSRVDDNARGGDIDLLIKPGQANLQSPLTGKIKFLGKLEKALGQRKIDVVIEREGDPRPIVKVAHQSGIPL